MRIGTRSVLFGAHQFVVHPLFVAWAWWTLYGFPIDPRLWVSFFVHDLGYIGKPDMDGPEGERHPELGASIMHVFDRFGSNGHHWHDFSLLHSRTYARAVGKPPSRLCMADKLAIALTPGWLYLPLVRASGEIHEYMAHGKYGATAEPPTSGDSRPTTRHTQAMWYEGLRSDSRRYAYSSRDAAASAPSSSEPQARARGLRREGRT